MLLGIEYTLHFHRTPGSTSVTPVILMISPLTDEALQPKEGKDLPLVTWPVLGNVQLEQSLDS